MKIKFISQFLKFIKRFMKMIKMGIKNLLLIIISKCMTNHTILLTHLWIIFIIPLLQLILIVNILILITKNMHNSNMKVNHKTLNIIINIIIKIILIKLNRLHFYIGINFQIKINSIYQKVKLFTLMLNLKQ